MIKSLLLLYLLALIIGFIAGFGAKDQGVNKTTSGIQFFGMIAIFFNTFLYWDFLRALLSIVITVVGEFITFRIFYRR